MDRFRGRLVALSDPHSSRRLSTIGWMVTISLALLLLLPTLLFPLGVDQAVFYLGGKAMLQGGVLYRDFIDLKPPVIYALYAIGIGVFGNAEVSIRILDLLLQLATCALILRVVDRFTGNGIAAATAATLYALSYVGLSYSATAQAESYVGLLGLLMVWLRLHRPSTVRFVLIGALAAILFLLKFTFGIVLAAMAIGELIIMRESLRGAARNWLMMSAGFVLVLLLFVGYIVAFDASSGLMQMQHYIAGYSSVTRPSLLVTVQRIAQLVPAFLADNYSIVLSVLTVVGIGMSTGRASTDAERGEAAPQSTQRLLQFCALIFLLLIGSIIVEGKYLSYQFGRIFAFGVILGAWGTLGVFRLLMTSRFNRRYLVFLLVAALPFVLLYSPLLRYVHHAGAGIAVMQHGHTVLDNYYSTLLYYTRSEMVEIDRYIDAHRSANDQLYVASPHSGLFYVIAGAPSPRFPHSAIVVAPFAPQQWKDQTVRHLIETVPKWLVMQDNDNLIDLTGQTEGTETLYRQLPGIDSLMRTRYRNVMQTANFTLYERVD
jgi:4-amino-4-deoxy-L-arabinose transferase-like glycosyltransferase